jgi:hypothetical protein
MKKALHLTVIVLICLALFWVGSSSAKESQPACESLKYTQIDKDAILITEGFTYQKNHELRMPHLMGIKDVNEENAFILDQGSVAIPEFESAVNVTWEFLKPGIVFNRGGCVYTSKVEGATIKFTKEGVLVKDFEISGKH